jgi:hypothetical protein
LTPTVLPRGYRVLRDFTAFFSGFIDWRHLMWCMPGYPERVPFSHSSAAKHRQKIKMPSTIASCVSLSNGKSQRERQSKERKWWGLSEAFEAVLRKEECKKLEFQDEGR